MDIISFDPLPSHNSDNYPGEPAALPAHFLNDVPQELGDMDNELPCQGYTGGDHFGDYLALLADQAGLQLGAPEESLDWSTLPNHIMPSLRQLLCLRSMMNAANLLSQVQVPDRNQRPA